MRRLFVALLVTCVFGSLTVAEPYPARPVKIIVPLAPGGGTDIVTRHIAEGLRLTLGQPVIIENIGGAGTRIGMAAAARSNPDGYTLVVNGDTAAIFELIFANPTVNVHRDLVPIGFYASAPIVLVGSPQVKATNLDELIALARRAPGAVTITTSGLGTPHDLSNRLLMQQAGIKLNAIAYRGNGPALTDLMAGQVDVGMYTLTNVLGHVETGRLKALAVLGRDRSRFAPGIRSSAEFGMPELDVSSRYVMWAPARTSPEIVQKLAEALAAAARVPAVVDALSKAGFEPMAIGGGEAARQLGRELERWRPILEAAGVTPQ